MRITTIWRSPSRDALRWSRPLVFFKISCPIGRCTSVRHQWQMLLLNYFRCGNIIESNRLLPQVEVSKNFQWLENYNYNYNSIIENTETKLVLSLEFLNRVDYLSKTVRITILHVSIKILKLTQFCRGISLNRVITTVTSSCK